MIVRRDLVHRDWRGITTDLPGHPLNGPASGEPNTMQVIMVHSAARLLGLTGATTMIVASRSLPSQRAAVLRSYLAKRTTVADR